jgi:hypothetical protein
MKYWINTAAREHVLKGLAGGYTQANHGSDRILKKVSKGDVILFYSSKDTYPEGEPYQKFTACGIIKDEEVYQVTITDNFRPFRRNLTFVAMEEASIKPMIEELSFIQDPKHWGFPFMRGLFEIPKEDFDKIAAATDLKVDDLTL